MQTRRPQRMCLDCQTLTDTPVLTHMTERVSGPPWTAYACPDCAPRHLSQPRAMELITTHCTHCETCARPDDICPQGVALVRVHRRILRRAAKTPS